MEFPRELSLLSIARVLLRSPQPKPYLKGRRNWYGTLTFYPVLTLREEPELNELGWAGVRLCGYFYSVLRETGVAARVSGDPAYDETLIAIVRPTKI